MRGWIYNSDVESYKQLMESEHSKPSILQQTDEKSLVEMTASAMNTWMMVGKHFEYA